MRIPLFFKILRLKRIIICPRAGLFIALWLFTWSTAFSQDLRLNEIVANSDGTFPDEDGDSSDWIEIYNPTNQEIPLFGFGLSDDPEDLGKWIFPEVIISPQEYLVLFCSDKDRYTLPLHTNFKLKSSGEPLLLTNPDGEILDEAIPMPVSEGFGLAKLCGETCYWETLDMTTPEADNSSGSVITFSAPSGVFLGDTVVALGHSLGHEIRYTTDGSAPTVESMLYQGPIILSDPTGSEAPLSAISTSTYWSPPTGEVLQVNNIRARSFLAETPTSKVFSKAYSVGEENFELFSQYPVFSIQCDPDSLFSDEYGIHVPGVNYDPGNSVWSGNFFQRGVEWERDVHIDYFEQGNYVWSQTAGMRIHGGKTRNAPQKSFRLYARNELGAAEFNHPFFDTKDKTVFDKVLLRCHFGCWNKTAIKDGVSAYIAKEMDFDSQHSQLSAVYLNGEYWGLFAIRDFFDAQYIVEEHWFEEDSVDILNHGSGFREGVDPDWGVYEGDNLHYAAMMDFIENADVTIEENYNYISTQMDISSMIDYYCTQVYFAQKDWPAGNHKVWRGGDDSKWRWLLFDMDSGWGYLGASFDNMERVTATNSSNYSNPPWATYLFRKMLQSPYFVDAFTQRYACLMKNEFDADTVGLALDRFVDEYTPGMPRQIDRWHSNSSMSDWTSRVNSKLYSFKDGRKTYAAQNLADYLNIPFDPEEYDCEDGIITGTDERDGQYAAVRIYPNPSRDKIWIDTEAASADSRVRIYDSLGRLISDRPYSFHQQIDIGQLAPGIYVAVIDGSGRRLSEQFVKN